MNNGNQYSLYYNGILYVNPLIAILFFLALWKKSIILASFILDVSMDEAGKTIRCVSFDIFRSLGIPDTLHVKPESVFQRMPDLKTVDWILFPPYNLVNLMAYALRKQIFPSISTYHLGFDKIQLTRALMARFPEQAPQTLICSPDTTGREQILDQMVFPFVMKAPRNSQGRGVSLIRNKRDFMDFADRQEILYAQEYLDIRRDLRVVRVSNKTVLAYWRAGAEGQFLNNVAAGGTIDYSGIPDKAIDLVAEISRELDINYAGFDVAEVDGRFYVLEYNLFFGTQALNEKKIALAPVIYQYLLEQSQNRIKPTEPLLPLAM